MTYHYSVTYAVPGVDWRECRSQLLFTARYWDCDDCGTKRICGSHFCHAACDHPEWPRGEFDPPALEFGQMDRGRDNLRMAQRVDGFKF